MELVSSFTKKAAAKNTTNLCSSNHMKTMKSKRGSCKDNLQLKGMSQVKKSPLSFMATATLTAAITQLLANLC